jgi:hypothetical protein
MAAGADGTIQIAINAVGTEKLKAGVTGANQSMGQIQQGATKAQGSLNQFGTSVEKAGGKVQSFGSKVKSGFANVGVGISAMAGITTAAWSLFNAYDALQDAEVKLAARRTKAAGLAERAAKFEEKLIQARQKVTDTANAITKAEQALAKAREEGDPTKIANAETAVAKAKREHEDATRKVTQTEKDAALAMQKSKDAANLLKVAEGDLKEAQAQFYTGLLPMVATLGGSFAPMMALSAKRTNEFGATLPGATKGVQGMSAASKLLHFALGPIGLILIGIGTALALVATNAFGIRDRFNEFGKALGDALPFLRPVLELIKGLGGALGILGPESEAAKKGLGKAFGDMSKQITGFVTTALKKLGRFGNFFKALADLVIAGDFKGALNLLKGGITEFSTFVKNRFNDIKGIIVGVFKAIGIDLPAIFGEWGTKLQNAIGIMASYFQGLWNQAKPHIDDLTNHLGDAFTALTKGDVLGAFNIIKSYFQGLVQQAKPWIDDLKNHINTAFAQLKSGDVLGAFDTMKQYFQGLLDAAKPLVDDLKQHVLDAFKAIGIDLPKLGEQVVKFFTEEAPKWGKLMVEKFLEGVKWLQDNVWPVMLQFGDQIAKWMFEELPKIVALLPVLFMGAVKWAQDNVWPALVGLAEQISAWITANAPTIGKTIVDAIGAAIKWLQENVWPGFVSFATEAYAWAQANGPAIGKAIIEAIYQGLVWIASQVKAAMDQLWQLMKTELGAAGPDLGSLIAAGIAVSIKFTDQHAGPIIVNLSEEIRKASDAYDWKATTDSITSHMQTSFQSNVEGFAAIGAWIAQQIAGGAGGGTGGAGGAGGAGGGGKAATDWQRFADNVVKVLTNTVNSNAAGFQMIGAKIVEYLTKGAMALNAAIAQLGTWVINQIKSAISAKVNELQTIGTNIWTAITTGLANAPKTIWEIINTKLGGIPGTIAKMGTDIWTNITDAIASAPGDIWAAISKKIGEVPKAITDIFNMFKGIFGGVPEAAAAGGGAGGGLLVPPNAADFKTQFDAITAAAQAAATTMATAFTTAAATAQNNIAGIKLAFPVITQAATAAAQQIATAFTSAAATAQNNVAGIKLAFNVINQAIGAAANTLRGAFTTAAAAASAAVQRIATAFPGVYNAGQQAANTIMNAFGNMANNAIAAIKRIQAAINALKPKTITIPVTDNGSISRVQRNINNLRGKTVYIDVRQRLVGPRYVQHGFHQLVTKPTMFIAGEKRPEMVNVTPTTNMQQPTKTAGPRGSTIRHAPVTLSPLARGGGGVMHHTTILKIGEREWKRHTDDVLLDGTEAHY